MTDRPELRSSECSLSTNNFPICTLECKFVAHWCTFGYGGCFNTDHEIRSQKAAAAAARPVPIPNPRHTMISTRRRVGSSCACVVQTHKSVASDLFVDHSSTHTPSTVHCEFTLLSLQNDCLSVSCKFVSTSNLLLVTRSSSYHYQRWFT